jgi:hypothetical protein
MEGFDKYRSLSELLPFEYRENRANVNLAGGRMHFGIEHVAFWGRATSRS